MADILVIPANELYDPFDILDDLIWEDTPDEHRWENHHAGTIRRNDKFWMIYWVTGLTENQEDRFFEDEIEDDGTMILHEAESFEVKVTKWCVK